jgi:hypothetical protein
MARFGVEWVSSHIVNCFEFQPYWYGTQHIYSTTTIPCGSASDDNVGSTALIGLAINHPCGSVFVRVERQYLKAKLIATCGFSPIPMIVVLILGILICSGLIWCGRAKVIDGQGLMPVVGSCLIAIVAACRPPPYDTEAALCDEVPFLER